MLTQILFRKTWASLLFLFIISLTLVTSQFQPIDALESEIATTWKYAQFPVENFQGYTSPYGYRISPSTGKREFHYGLDIAAPFGSYIRNWWAGTVVELSDNTACGTQITIQSGPWQHIYCHMNGYVVKSPKGNYLLDAEGGIQIWQGQSIPAGARIGRVGMTGLTTGPHLHWGLKYNNQFIDPGIVLRAMYQNS